MKYIFFIGGSGARAYKAFLHACAAGIIHEDKVEVILLDADSQNDACKTSCMLFDIYQQHRNMLCATQFDSPAFRCDVRMKWNKPISPVVEDIAHLEQVTGGMNTNIRKRVLKWFYSEEERIQDLEKGFYAHPNIGCIFFQDFGGNQYLDRFIDSITQDLKTNEDTRIIIVGSVFGGTGAAGIPSVLKILEERCKKENISRGTLAVGAVLIAPYFKVAKKETRGSSSISIDSDNFFGNTRAALDYYRFISNKFEKIYLVGQKNLDLVNPDYADGGEKQDNKPHIVEVFAAMAIKDFLAGGSGETKLVGHVMDRNENQQITWASLDPDFYNLVDMARTQTILETAIYPYISGKAYPSSRRGTGMYQWYKIYNIDSAASQQSLDKMRQYTDAFLEWLYLLQYSYAEGQDELLGDKGTALFNTELLANLHHCIKSRNTRNVRESIGHEKQGWRKYQEDFNNLVETAEKIEFVAEKIIVILSGLGVVPASFANLGIVGLFLKLFSLAQHKQIEEKKL